MNFEFNEKNNLRFNYVLQGSQYWLGSYSENQQFFEELFSAARVRIYTVKPLNSGYVWTSHFIFITRFPSRW